MRRSCFRPGKSKNPTGLILTTNVLSFFLAFFSPRLATVSGARDYCYSDLGCFPLGPEFYHPKHRPFNARPWHRRRVNTRFELFNRQHPEGFLLEAWHKENLQLSGFGAQLETKIIIPGWLDGLKRTLWIRRLKDLLLETWHPVNIIIVHWRNFTPYTVATANSRVVGAEMANLISWLEQELHYNRANYHLIGHSLGAHISGYCGDRVPGLGRITALDPARPFFQHMPKSVRLDRGDARFVDAIHSDFTPENAILLLMSFGMTTPVGHVDFYPNGPPLLQPGCLRDTLTSVRDGIRKGLQHDSLALAFLEAVRYLTACDHQRSHEWFVESVLNRQCTFVGVRCSDYEGLISGRCTCDDSPSACAIMGIHADQMYLNGVHEDIWPLKKKQPNLAQDPTADIPIAARPTASDLLMAELETMAKEHQYAQLMDQSHRLRNPDSDVALEAQLMRFKDAAFLDYLRQVSLSEQQQQQTSNSMLLASLFQDEFLSSFRRKDSVKILKVPPMGPGELLMSQFDEDIERWYEDSSRWYLKTANKPNYCVNQYQIQVFLGDLRAQSGKDELRANLIISIVGSRGRLMHQRFVPTNKKLSAFTMQPFFIILEAPYSLGSIESIAIAWESRNEPDPIQATVSFQSPLLEAGQSIWPTYKAKHPPLSATLKYDHTGGFSPPAPGSQVIKRRMMLLDQQELSCNNQLGCSSGKLSEELDATDLASSVASSRFKYYLNSNDALDNKQTAQQPTDIALAVLNPKVAPERRDILLGDHLASPSQSEFLSDLLEASATASGKITAKLNNVPLVTSPSRQQPFDQVLYPSDLIVINHITISPIKAQYGKSGRVGKTFCPARKNQLLRQDQTIKLARGFLGQHHCHQYNRRKHVSTMIRLMTS